MMKYDTGFLHSAFLNSLSAPQVMEWIQITDIRPKPNHLVLLFGSDGRQEVGRLDYRVNAWNIAGQLLSYDTFTHWRLLPEGPSSK